MTLLGTGAQIGTGFIGLDLPGDIRDITYDFQNWEWSWSHAGQTAMDFAGVLPVIGPLKYSDEILGVTKRTSGFGAGDPPVRVEGPWTRNDVYNGLQGRPPRSLDRPQIHHGDQMPGVPHEVPVDIHQKGGLHGQPNQGVTDEMRASDRNLHW